MDKVLIIIQIVTAVLLITAILIQAKGTGFGRSWGGAASFARRGLEKVIFRSTFVLAVLFLLVSLLQLIF